MQIYIMDRDYDVMKKLESLITGYDRHNTKCFTTSQQLVDAVRKIPPDIVLIDVDTLNGLPAVKLIQSENIETKIIMVSKEREKVSECFLLHASGFLIKPIDEEKLKEQLFRAEHPLLARIKYGSEWTATI